MSINNAVQAVSSGKVTIDEIDALFAEECETATEVEKTPRKKVKKKAKVSVEPEKKVAQEVEAKPASKTKKKVKETDEKTPRISTAGLKPEEALRTRYGSKVYSIVVLENADAELSEKELKVLVDKRLAEFDELAKKVGEKINNLFQHIADGTALSNYTKIAIDLLKSKDSIASSDIRQAYLDTPYKVGTANAQASQMMKLLPALKLVTRDGSTLVKNKESLILEMLK